MQLEPFGWSVVLVGRWNPAILSPQGIKTYVYGLPPDAQVQVAVPLDGISAYMVSNPEESLMVHVENERLQVDVQKCTYETLQKGMSAAANALNALPITPISAAGFNLNFRSSEIDESLISATDAAIDNAIGDQGYNIIGRVFSRSLAFGDGKINLTILRKENEFHINFNFHLDTKDVDKVKAWLATTPESIKIEVEKIAIALNVQLGEQEND